MTRPSDVDAPRATTPTGESTATTRDTPRGTSEDETRTQRGRLGPVGIVVVAVLALGLGVGLSLWLSSGGTDEDATPTSATAPPRDVDAAPDALASAGFEALPPPPTEIPPAPAPDARSAVEGFLAAEANDDFEASYQFLSAGQRDTYRSPAGWVAAHADVMPPVTAFEVGEVDAGPDRTTMSSLVGFEPGLDEVVGLTPARARVTWAVSEGSDGWGVDLQASTFEPVYAPEVRTVDAVRAWVGARQSCERTGEWGGALLGQAGLAGQLCETNGEVEVGRPRALEQFDAQPFTAAFGPEATTWARVVPVRSPVAMQVVLAPVGPQWRVVGVLGPRPETGR